VSFCRRGWINEVQCAVRSAGYVLLVGEPFGTHRQARGE
jgi:hypothetical protein